MPCGTLLQTGSYSMTSTRDAERHPYFLFKNFGKYRENVGINRFCMYVEGNEDDHSHQPYAEADKRVRSEAGQIQAVRGESRRIRPVGRQPCRIHRCEVASRPRQDVQNGPRGGVPVPGDNTPRIIDDRAGKSYRNRRPGPDHRGLPNMVMGGSLPRPRVVRLQPTEARLTFHSASMQSEED